MVKYIFQHDICLKQSLRAVLAIAICFCMNNIAHAQQQKMIIRISKIEIHPQYLNEYKTSTLKMVKSLKLVDMEAMDLEAAAQIFKKLKE